MALNKPFFITSPPMEPGLQHRRMYQLHRSYITRTTMKTRKQILAVVFLTTILMSSSAQAGFFDWFTSNKVQAQEARNGSFDQLYASVTSSTAIDTDKPIISVTTNAIEGFATPSGTVSKVLRKTYFVEVSAYTSEVAQTDDSPFITAKGTHVRDGIVATNMFPFGTTIKIPKLYGDKIFVVEDRMNKRYQNNVDIWFTDKTEALKLGRRQLQIEVIQ
jgi:3D (Asp-Asp-Asp) domain-containing protein